MKKIITTAAYILGVFALGFLSLNQAHADTCTINNVNFTDITDINGATTTLSIESNGCEDGLSIELIAIDRAKRESIPIQNLPPVIFPQNDGRISIDLIGSEEFCYGGNKNAITQRSGSRTSTIIQQAWPNECIHFVQIKNNNDLVFNPDAEALKPIDYINNTKQGLLAGDCNGFSCDGLAARDWEAKLQQGVAPNRDSCEFSDADVFFTPTHTGGLIGKTVRLNIKSKNKCDGIPLFIRLQRTKKEKQKRQRSTPTDKAVDLLGDGEAGISGDYLEVRPRAGQDLTIDYVINGSTCSTNGGCQVAVVIERVGSISATRNTRSGGKITSTREGRLKIYNSNAIIEKHREGRTLSPVEASSVIIGSCNDCEDIDDPEWGFLDTNGISSAQRQTATGNAQVLELKKEFDVNNPCFVASTGRYDPDCYELLAPIPGLGTTQADGRSSINLKETSIGEYVNIMVNIVLGLMMVIAVIMIVVAGVQYMTVESLYGKTDAKKRIGGAVFGLILGLGIYTILNTINPELLEVNFGKDIESVEFKVLSADEIDLLSPAELKKAGYPDGYHQTVTNKKKTVGLVEAAEKKILIEQTSAGGTLVKLDQSITIKPGTIQHTNITNSVATKAFADKLLALDQKLKIKGINIRLTEVFGPTTTKHGSKCHYVGTCVDLAINTASKTYTKEVVSEIVRQAVSVNLVPQFETSRTDINPREFYLESDLHPAYVLPLKSSKITGEHFSIYDGK